MPGSERELPEETLARLQGEGALEPYSEPVDGFDDESDDAFDVEHDPDMDGFSGDAAPGFDRPEASGARELLDTLEDVELEGGGDVAALVADIGENDPVDEESDDEYDELGPDDPEVSGAGNEPTIESLMELIERSTVVESEGADGAEADGRRNVAADDLLEMYFQSGRNEEAEDRSASDVGSAEVATEDSSHVSGESWRDESSSLDGLQNPETVGGDGPARRDAIRRNGQRRYVKLYNAAVGRGSPLRKLRKRGAACSVDGSGTLGIDVISMALTAGALGIPVPTSLLARLGPELTLQLSGTITTGDDHKIRSAIKIKVSGALNINIAEKAGASASVSAGISGALVGSYDNLEHFVAHYLRSISDVVTTFVLYKAGKFVKRMLGRLGGRGTRLKNDDPQYSAIRELERRRRTRVKAISVDTRADVRALMGLFGAGAGISVTGKRFTRKINFDRGETASRGRKHERKTGFVIEGVTSVDAGPFSGTLSLSHIYNDANPDNDGTYITATISGSVEAVANLLRAPVDATADISVTAGGTLMDLLSGTVGATIEKMSLPVGSVGIGINAGTQVTLVWYQSGSTTRRMLARDVSLPSFKLLYKRATVPVGLSAGVGGVPLYGGLTLGLGAGFGLTFAGHETIGHSSIAYVQTIYLGLQADDRGNHEGRARWLKWARKHRDDLEKMRQSRNVRRELHELATSLGRIGTFQDAYAGDDVDQWLGGVMALFDAEGARRRGSRWSRYASYGDFVSY